MTDPKKITEMPGMRHHLAAVGRDVLTISATVSLLGTLVWFAAAPHLMPWLLIPEQLAAFEDKLNGLARPRLVEFQGTALLVDKGPFKPGDDVRFVYNLRRNADCTTDIQVSWYSVRTGVRITTAVVRAVQAPVTTDFAPFILTRKIPENLPDGLWVYYPLVVPVDCGVYRPYNGNMSEVFEIKREER